LGRTEDGQHPQFGLLKAVLKSYEKEGAFHIWGKIRDNREK